MVLNDIINQAASRGTSFNSRRRPSRKISMMLSNHDDEEGPLLKERLTDAMYKAIDIFCVWDCCMPYIKAAEYISMVIFDPFTDLFITLCIVVNTLFMALDQHDMNPRPVSPSPSFPSYHHFITNRAIYINFVLSVVRNKEQFHTHKISWHNRKISWRCSTVMYQNSI